MSLLIQNIGTLLTPTGNTPSAGRAQNEALALHNVSVLIENGVISRIGADCPDADEVFDAGGRLVTPALTDCHTHLPFGGWRQHELPMKLAGAGYLDILNAGGGILDTVRHTRAMSESALSERLLGFMDELLALGVTCAEAKSGYGLNLDDELKQLAAVHEASALHIIDLVPTFLGAHAIPPEYAGRADAFIDFMCETVLPAVKRAGLADYADVFCETGVFDAEQSRRYLECAKRLGFMLRVHADEIDAIGGSELAGDLGAVTAEHLIAITDGGIAALGDGGVIAALLPATSFYLGKAYAPARRLIETGVPVAVASDFNPGSCPSLNLQFCIHLACTKYRMLPNEVLCAVTKNAACAVGRGRTHGTAEPGKAADLMVWEAEDFELPCYRFGSNLTHAVVKDGRIVWRIP